MSKVYFLIFINMIFPIGILSLKILQKKLNK